MTDTDDTDDLLIPQDFFVIESEDSEHGGSSSRYFSVVDSLIEKVDTLKKRIKSIESRETLLSTSLETTLDRSYNMQKPEHKLNRSDNLFPVKSAQCTPQKPYNKFGLNSLPASPNSYRFNGGKCFIYLQVLVYCNFPFAVDVKVYSEQIYQIAI